MDTLQASTEFLNNLPVNDVEKCDETDLNKIKALVTPEQILSDTVARKRRTLSKKHTNRVREQTPGRDVVENTSSEDERIEKPKTPERRRKKLSKVKNDPDNLEPRESTPKPNDQKKNSLVSTTQNEILALLNKAKRGLNAKKEIAKRSQSVPSQLLEFDELNIVTRKSSLRTTNDVPKAPIRKSSFRKTADEPKPAHIADEPKVTKRKVADAIPKRKPSPSPKIIEILDPKTSKVVKKISRGVPELRVTLRGLICIFKYLSVREIYKLYQEFKRERWREWDKIRRLRNKCVSDLLAIMIFCGLGGIMFKYVEGAFENFYKCGVKRVKRDFIDVLWYRSHNLREDEWKSLARSKLRVFEEQLHVAHEAGMRTYSGQRSWSFLNGVIYCLTIVTTIGYGHMFPTTNTGMALTIVYAIIGIPLFLIALTDFGKLFTRGIKFVWSFVRRLYYTGSCRKVRKTAHVQDLLQGAQMVYDIARLRKPSMFVSAQDAENPKSPGTEHSATPTTPALSHFEIDDEFNLPISVAIFILVLYIFLGAVMYCIWEKWDFFGSFYFVFISLSTIGFGDYVPNDPFCMMASVIYLVFGLALMSMCINVVQVKLSDTFSDASAKLGATIGLNVNEEDGSIDTVTPAPIEIPDVHQDTSKSEDREVAVSRKSGKRDKSSKTNDSENNAAENEVTS